MSKGGNIKVKIEIEGGKEYTTQMKNFAAAEKELQSEMKKTQAQFKGEEKSTEALTKKKEILVKQIELQNKKLDEQRKMVSNALETQNKYANNTQKLEKILEDVKNGTGELTEEQKKACEEMGFNVNKVKDLENALETSNEQYEAAGRAVKDYQTKANDAETGLIGLNHELLEVDKSLTGFQDEAEEGAKGLDDVGKAAEDAGKKSSGLGEIIKGNVISSAVLSGLKELVKGIKEVALAAINTGADFEASMSQVAATMGISVDEINNGSEAYKTMEEAARKCGETTMYSATEAGEALNYLALAGYDASKAAETLPKVLDLAAAGGMDLATASDLVTDAMAALGMETSELDTYIDEMAKTAQKSNTSVQQLGEATLICAATAKNAGVDLETMNTALGVLANNGIKGAEGGTHLRNVLLLLAAPTDKASEELKRLGIETVDAGGNLRSLEDIMRDLAVAVSDMGTADKARAMNTIFNKTDISAVNALLKSTNGEFASLKDEISNASGAASDMAKTMNDNLKGQLTVLQSNLEALGISAYKVFDDELKGGVSEASKAVKRLNDSVSDGQMHTSLSRLSTAMGDFITQGAGLAEDVLPKIIDAAAWCIDNLDIIASGVAGIATASLTMGKVLPAITAAKAAWLAYKAETERATVSQWLLNTAMGSNPAGVLIVAISGLAAALGAYTLLNKNAAKETSLLTEEQQKLVDSANDLRDSSAKNIEARSKDRESMEASKSMITSLRGELAKYVDSNGKVKESSDRVRTIVAELNELVPGLGLAYDETAQSLNMSTEEIKKNTDALWKQAEAAALQEQMTNVVKERIEVEKELKRIEDEYNNANAENVANARAKRDAIAELTEAQEAHVKVTKEVKDAVKEAEQAYEESTERTAPIIQAYHELQNRLSELGEEEAYLTERIGDNSDAMNEAGEAADGMSDAFSEATDEISDSWEELHDSAASSIAGQISLFDEYKEATKHTKEEVLKNMEDQVKGVRDWSDNIQELSKKGISEGLLQELLKMGPEGAGYVKAFNEMTGEELREASKLFEEAVLVPESTIQNVEDGYKKTGEAAYTGFKTALEEGKIKAQEEVKRRFDELGEDVPESVKEGTDRKRSEAVDAAKDMAEEAVEKTKDVLGISGKSKVFGDIGESIPSGMGKGISDKAKDASDAAKKMAQDAVKGTKDEANPEYFTEIGEQAGDGFVKGLLSKIPAIQSAAKQIADAAKNATKNALDIESPSKVFAELGRYTGDGFIEGFENSMADFKSIVNEMVPTTEDIRRPEISSGSTVNNYFTINGAAGQDPREIAVAVQDILISQFDTGRAAFA